MKLFGDLQLLRWQGSFPSTFIGSFSLKQITWLAFQSAAKFVQDVGPVHPGAVMMQPEQRRIANTRFLSQAIDRPPLASKDLGEPANNHVSTITDSDTVCQRRAIYKIYFTLERWFSIVGGSGKKYSTATATTRFDEAKRHVC